MPPSLHLERRWIMDTFGRVLHYDAAHQRIIASPFCPQEFSNLFTFIPVPEQLPHRAVLRLVNTIPSSLPSARFVSAGEHELALEDMGTGLFLCSHAGEGTCDLAAEKIGVWEKLMLLSKEMIFGLSILTDPDMVEVFRDDEPCNPLIFDSPDWGRGNIARIADTHIFIAENLHEIAKLANAVPKEPMELSIRAYYGEEILNIKAVPKRSLQLTTLAADAQPEGSQ